MNPVLNKSKQKASPGMRIRLESSHVWLNVIGMLTDQEGNPWCPRRDSSGYCSLCGGDLSLFAQLGMLKCFICVCCGMQFLRKAGRS
jgi:hypothetical protein